MDSFTQLTLSAGTLDAIAAKGYDTPSPIQVLAIPPLLEGRDLIAQAQTGTGKTAAFGIPLIERHRDTRDGGIVALTLVPTRELAIQVAEEIEELARGSELKVAVIYGGVGFGHQVHALQRRGTTILVATPGRLIDHLERGNARLEDVQTLILDEADRMLDMGFVRDVERILREVPKKRQTMLFSATVPPAIRDLSRRYLHDPVSVRAETGPTATENAEQFYLRVDRPDKQSALLNLLHQEKPERAIVFTRTKHLARRLADRLQKSGWGAVALQGNMSQGQRERAMGAFRDGKARILVATDVAARGLDVPEVSHVVNFDLPDAPEAYVHRIGRTARMGRIGRAYTFVQPDEGRDLQAIQRTSGARINLTELAYGAEPPHGPDQAVVVAAPQPQRRAPAESDGPPRARRALQPQGSGTRRGRGRRGGGGGGGGGRRRY